MQIQIMVSELEGLKKKKKKKKRKSMNTFNPIDPSEKYLIEKFSFGAQMPIFLFYFEGLG